jgi:Chlorophyllase enzyme
MIAPPASCAHSSAVNPNVCASATLIVASYIATRFAHADALDARRRREHRLDVVTSMSMMLIAGRMRAWLASIVVVACGHSSSTTTTGGDASADGSDGAIAYGSDGPVPYMVVTATLTAGTTFDVTAYIPSSSGKHPAVGFSAGSQQTAAGYAPYGERLASYGIATIISDDPGILTNTGDVVPNAVYVVATWIPSTFADSIDMAKIGLAGHSRGGAASLLAAEGELDGKVVAWFGLDPVDNEFGMAPTAYARTDLPSLEIPTAFLGAEVASNCAPTADSYPTLYPLAPSPSTLIVGLNAGHVELELQAACIACSICTPSGTADPDVVLAYAVRYTTAFFARELLGDSSVGATFDGAGGSGDVAAGLVTITSK